MSKYSVLPAVLCYLFVVDSEHDGEGDPLSHLLANSRSMLRSSFITSRATFICRSNSGS